MRSTTLRVLPIAALTVTFCLAGQVRAQEAAPPVQIDNFGRVDASYYRGAQPKGRDYADLAALGIRTVINLTSHDADRREKAMTEQAGMRYIQIPMTTRRVPTSEQLEKFLTIVREPANQPVYVHCVGGRHRTGVMTAVYRMVKDRWDAARAFAEMKRFKFGADFLHPEFKRFVFAYPAALGVPSTAPASGR